MNPPLKATFRKPTLDSPVDPGPLELDLAGEFGPDSVRWVGADAEGATAPETLRQTDRENIRTLESHPKRVRRRSKAVFDSRNLSGFTDSGGARTAELFRLMTRL